LTPFQEQYLSVSATLPPSLNWDSLNLFGLYKNIIPAFVDLASAAASCCARIWSIARGLLVLTEGPVFELKLFPVGFVPQQKLSIVLLLLSG
jgi:hypothetical protein